MGVMGAIRIIEESPRHRGTFVEVTCAECRDVFAFTRGIACAAPFCCHKCRAKFPGVARRLDAGREARPVAPAPRFPKLPAKMRFVRRAA